MFILTEPRNQRDDPVEWTRTPPPESKPMIIELSSDNKDSTISPVFPWPILQVPYVPEPSQPKKNMKKT